MSAGPYSIGSNHWPGLSKLIEEAGEVGQVAGKILGTGGKVDHWDGSNLKEKLEEELADLSAAILFVMAKNNLDQLVINRRIAQKLELFERWHEAQR